MNNKGFTLIELVVTIGLLGLIGLIIAANLVGLQSKQSAKDYDNYKARIENAACTYIESKNPTLYLDSNLSNMIKSKKQCLESTNKQCFVSTGLLKEKGFLDEDLVDPTTSENVTDNEKVRIFYDNGIKTCKYVE